jgi:hypothetical protein
LYENFGKVIEQALSVSSALPDLSALREHYSRWRPAAVPTSGEPAPLVEDTGLVEVIARGETGILTRNGIQEEVVVEDYRYTRQGPMYVLRHPVRGSESDIVWTVPIAAVAAETPHTRKVLFSIDTGEVTDPNAC